MPPGRKPRVSRAVKVWTKIQEMSFMDLREFLQLMFPDMPAEERGKMGIELIQRMMK